MFVQQKYDRRVDPSPLRTQPAYTTSGEPETPYPTMSPLLEERDNMIYGLSRLTKIFPRVSLRKTETLGRDDITGIN